MPIEDGRTKCCSPTAKLQPADHSLPIGDLVDDATGIVCLRRALPLLGPIQGRAGGSSDDTRRSHDQRLLPYYIFRHHAKSEKVREYQFVQFANWRIERA